MQLMKFLFGLVLVQIITLILVQLSPNGIGKGGLLRLAIPLFFISLLVAFWFASLCDYHHKDEVDRVKSSFAEEREKLKVNAERAKTRVVKQAQKEIAREAQMTHAKANFKVGAAFAGVLGVGVLFVIAQMMTVGLLTIATAGGALGGYIWRGKRMQNQLLVNNKKNLKVIESKPLRFKLPFQRK